MNAQELYDEWTEGESTGVRPKRIQEIRDDLMDATGIHVPHRIPEIEPWLDRMRGHMTKKLKEAKEEVDGEDDDSGDGAEE